MNLLPLFSFSVPSSSSPMKRPPSCLPRNGASGGEIMLIFSTFKFRSLRKRHVFCISMRFTLLREGHFKQGGVPPKLNEAPSFIGCCLNAIPGHRLSHASGFSRDPGPVCRGVSGRRQSWGEWAHWRSRRPGRWRFRPQPACCPQWVSGRVGWISPTRFRLRRGLLGGPDKPAGSARPGFIWRETLPRQHQSNNRVTYVARGVISWWHGTGRGDVD